MPQIQLPVFPVGTTKITSELALEKRDGKVVSAVAGMWMKTTGLKIHSA